MRAHIGPTAAALALSFSLGIGAASAGDRCVGMMCPTPYPYNWSGVYIGGHGGGAHTQTEWTFTSPTPTTEDFEQTHTSWIGGVQGGVQWQWSRTVLGAEVSYSWLNAEETTGSVALPGTSLTSEVNNLLLVTGKVGYAYENFLAYAKGGWASGDVDFRSTVAGALATSSSEREHGWTAGIGVDYAINPHISIGVEYDYIRLNVDTRDQIAGPAGAPGSTVIDGGVDIQTVMARLNFKLGPRAPEAPPPLK